MNLTLDSSVVVEYVLEGANLELCRDLLNKAFANEEVCLHEPSIFLFEFINAVNRGSKNKKDNVERTKKAIEICELFIKRKNTFFHSLDVPFWRDWHGCIRNNCEHKTQDEIFLYTAKSNNSILVTLDILTIKKPVSTNGGCVVMTPYDCLKKLQMYSPFLTL